MDNCSAYFYADIELECVQRRFAHYLIASIFFANLWEFLYLWHIGGVDKHEQMLTNYSLSTLAS